MRSNLLLSLFLVLLCSCNGSRTPSSQEVGDTVAFKYATQLTVVKYDGYTVASLKDPWKKGAVLHQYILVPDSLQQLPSHLLPLTSHHSLIRTPLKRSIIFSTVHCAMLMEMGRQDCIAGVADLKYIKLPWIQEQVRAGRMTDVGDGLSPVIEKIIDQRPDALLMSPFENSGGYGKLDELSIPIVECAEYMEPSPLARAEWIRFYGMLFGCEATADSLFAVVDSSYQALKKKASVENRPTKFTTASGETFYIGHPSIDIPTLVDKMTGSVWYVPGGRSTIGQMITDAGGDYPWADDDHSGSLALPFENVLERASNTLVWIFRYSSDHDITYKELESEYHGYSQFRAFRDRRVYGCNVEQSLFYEETPFRPDWLLGDFIRILHPDIKGLPPLRYYHPLTQ